MTSIFLSHNHADKPFVRKLASDLTKSGVKVWLDEAEILIGDSLIEKIGAGIETTAFLGAVLSTNSVGSSWVKKELEIALNEEIDGKRRKVLPILIEDCAVPSFLKGKLYADFRRPDSYKLEFNKLLKSLGISVDLSQNTPFEPETVLIPKGSFLMGSDPAIDPLAEADEQPQHELFLDYYYLGKTPVTNGQFAEYVRQTNKIPERWKGFDYDPQKGIRPGLENRPVVWISWYDAADYCAWLSAETGKKYKLPSEAEWEKGARGTDGLIYPWGNRYSAELARNADTDLIDHTETSVDVDSYHRGASPYGLLHMAGNVQEWTSSLWGENPKTSFPYPYDPGDGREDLSAPENIGRVVRGGSWMHRSQSIRCAYRNGSHPNIPGAYIGFRVAKVA
ncbi:MAG TPA: SUMF1/EgtB/PvdO family nonheme iron enzyme [Pyrinomonadaceae bacterium]|nr:SUMF1/EgtB/PvdO family nonheme iron enzyme [Pyrinomonadaceae bacterium]